jgi:hypothetical protein
MDDKEMRDQLAALERQNAKLKKQKEIKERIAALETENAALDAQVEGAAADESADAKPAAGAAAVEHKAAGAAADAAGSAAEPAPEAVMVRRGGPARTIFVGVLVFLTCLAVVVTGITFWTHYTILNTNGYVKLVGPIGKDPKAIKALSDYVSTQIVTATDLQQRTAGALPHKASFLAAPITSAVDGFISTQTAKVLSTPQAYDLWIKVNTIAHQSIVGLLRGQNNYTYIQGNDVKLDTLPLVSQALVWIDGKPPGALGSKFSPPVIAPGTPTATAIQQVSSWTGRPLPSDFGQITLLKSNALGPAQKAVRLFDALVWVLPIVALLLAAATVWLSSHRRRTLIELGVGVAVALVLTRVIVKQASNAIVNSLHEGNGLTIAKDVVHSSLDPLTTITIWIVVIGVLVAFAAWIAGRRDVRVAVVSAGRSVIQGQHLAVGGSPAAEWVERHVQLLRWAGLIVGVILLTFATSSWLGIALWILLTLVYEGVLSLVVREWPFRHHPGGETVIG